MNYLTWENVGTTLPDSMKYDYVLSSSEVGTKIGQEIIIDNDTVKQKFGIKQTIGDQVDLIDNDLTHLSPNDNKKTEDEVRKEVVMLCSKFPIYKNLR